MNEIKMNRKDITILLDRINKDAMNEVLENKVALREWVLDASEPLMGVAFDGDWYECDFGFCYWRNTDLERILKKLGTLADDKIGKGVLFIDLLDRSTGEPVVHYALLVCDSKTDGLGFFAFVCEAESKKYNVALWRLAGEDNHIKFGNKQDAHFNAMMLFTLYCQVNHELLSYQIGTKGASLFGCRCEVFHVEGSKQIGSVIKIGNRKNPKYTITLDHDIRKRYAIERKCDLWQVRGHLRHYKDGRTVFINAYEKGINRGRGDSKTTIKLELQEEE